MRSERGVIQGLNSSLSDSLATIANLSQIQMENSASLAIEFLKTGKFLNKILAVIFSQG